MTSADDTPVRTTAALRGGCASAVAIGLLLSLSPPAAAEDAASAREQARTAAADVQALTVRLARAQTAYDQALTDVGRQVADSVVARSGQQDAGQAARAATDTQTNTVRALYMSGGHTALVSTMLSAGDAGDLAQRAVAVDRVLRVATASAAAAARAHEAATRQAGAAARAADGSVVTAELVAQRAAAVDVLAIEAEQRLGRLSARARRLSEAEAAARALARARAKAAAAAAAAIAAVRVQAPPSTFFDLYQAAAPTCPGLPWTLLAAVGQVESGHGRNNGPSSAGAVGPMQFMPRTFAAYAVDGDHDGRTDPWSSADAVFTAARFLCSNGAGTPGGVTRALLRYNNAQWYVDLVRGVQVQLERTAAPTLPGA